MLRRTLCFALLCFGPLHAHAGALDDVRPGERVTIPGFAFAADKAIAADVTLRRIDVYAPGAKLYVVHDDGSMQEVPRSTEHLFVSDPAYTATRMYVAVDPKRQTFTGAVFDTSDTYSIAGSVGKRGLRVAQSKGLSEYPTEFACGGSPLALGGGADPLEGVPGHVADKAAPGAKGALRIAVVAVDTDNELMSLKFSNNTTTASTYFAQLFTAMNVMYERDLDLQLVQGTTFLRVGSNDPYPSTSATSTSAQLTEFGEHWRTNSLYTTQPGGAQVVPRTLAAMFSGKSTSPNSASGIAWLLDSGNYCTATGFVQGNGSTSGHYSMTRVFRFAGSNASHDATIIGHELGHNFGASHTHCSSKATGAGTVSTGTIDVCHSGESSFGCYSGPTSCPTDPADTSNPPRGTVMSYCHFNGSGHPTNPGGTCGSSLLEFHPSHETFLLGRLTTNVNNGCISTNAPAMADVSVVTTSATSSAQPGATVSYTITVANGGPDAATAVRLADPAPSGMTFVSASGGGCSAFPCVLGTINSGSQVVVTANFSVDGNATPGNVITNTASVSCSTTEQNTVNNSEGHDITVDAPPMADVGVSKTSATNSALPGAAVAFTITVANNGPSPATAVQLADPTPSGLVFVSASGGGCTTFPCALGTINSGSQAVVTANYTISNSAIAGTQITNTASVSTTSTDPANGNNSDGHTVTVSSPPAAGLVFRSGFEDGE